jgi:hypothetical protein
MQKKPFYPSSACFQLSLDCYSTTPPVFTGITSLDSWHFAAANSISHTPVGTVWGANKITRPDLGTARIHPIKFFFTPSPNPTRSEGNAARSKHLFREVWIAVCFGEPCPLNSRLFVGYPYFDL